MARLSYATARARAANGLELGLRVATAIRVENDEARRHPVKTMQALVDRGRYGDPREADPPLSIRQQQERDARQLYGRKADGSPVTELEHHSLTARRIAHERREQAALQPAASPVRPIGPRPWATSSSSADTSGQQLDLSGQPVPASRPPADNSPPPGRSQQLALSMTVAKSYHSKAWGGQVTEPPLPETFTAVIDGETVTARPVYDLDMTPDDHNRPAYLGPLQPHPCPGPATCNQRWLTDQELEEEE